MKNQLILFGATHARPESEKWRRFLDASGGGEIAYLTESGISIDAPDISRAILRVRESLAKQPGIMVALTTPGDGPAEILVASTNPKRILAPSRALLLDLNSTVEWLKLADGLRRNLAAAQCLIVPMTSTVDDKLDAFLASVIDLSDDVRTSMLFNLVTPPLESRVARLEYVVKEARSPNIWDLGTLALGSTAAMMIAVGWFSLSRQIGSIQDQLTGPSRSAGTARSDPLSTITRRDPSPVVEELQKH